MNVAEIFSGVVSHAMASGLFETVNQHEPKNAPGNGLRASVWLEQIYPTKSGLATTSAQLNMQLRIYSSMLTEPQDDIDPNLLRAVDVMMAAYTGDFQLGGELRNIDLLGNSGTGSGLSARFGYLNQDSKIFRVADITLPLLIKDLWTQVA